MNPTATDHALARALLGVPGVVAVALGGSRATGLADAASDTDLYAFSHGPAPDADAVTAALAPVVDDGRVTRDTTWGAEDHGHVAGALVEVMYVDLDAVGLDHFYDEGAAPTGYTTAWLHTLAGARVLADPTGTLGAVQERLRTYPEATRRRILDQAPVELAGYVEQVEKAQRRADWTNATDRRAALQATWFDTLFALNRRHHPGEKRLLVHAADLPTRPDDTVARWTTASLLRSDDPALPGLLRALVDDLLALVARDR